jgi:hypothetical protein
LSLLNAFRDADGFFGRTCSVFGVGARGEPSDAVTGFEVIYIARANGDDGAFCFAAEDFGLGGGVETGAEVAGRGLLMVCDEGRADRVSVRVNIVYAYVFILD